MTKKPDLSPAKGKRDNGVGDPPPATKIKETVVADPSISFTIQFSEDIPWVGDYLVQFFKAKIYLTDVPGDQNSGFLHVATVKVKSISDRSIYIYVPFGDPSYAPGQEFYFMLKLSGFTPGTTTPIVFNENDNIFIQHLVGGGIVEDGIPPTVKKKKAGNKK
jgi:hypothetical protein